MRALSECLKNKALYHYSRGQNCSQCLLKAAESCHGIKLTRNCLAMCEGINNGFGVGATCSVLIAGIMLFGIILDETAAKQARLALLSKCCERYGSLDCAAIKKWRKNGRACEDIVGEIAGMTEAILGEYI